MADEPQLSSSNPYHLLFKPTIRYSTFVIIFNTSFSIKHLFRLTNHYCHAFINAEPLAVILSPKILQPVQVDNERNILINFIKATFPISEFAAKTIAENFHKISYKRNDFIRREGKICSNYLFLEEGFMRSFVYDTNGNDVTTGFFSKEQMVFEVSSYFQRTPTKENIQTLTNCNGWVGDYELFQTLFHSLPEFREFGRTILVKGFVALKERTLSMINQKAEERYEVLLKSNPEIFQNVPLKYIASYLGVKDTSLSRIRKEFSHK